MIPSGERCRYLAREPGLLGRALACLGELVQVEKHEQQRYRPVRVAERVHRHLLRKQLGVHFGVRPVGRAIVAEPTIHLLLGPAEALGTDRPDEPVVDAGDKVDRRRQRTTRQCPARPVLAPAVSAAANPMPPSFMKTTRTMDARHRTSAAPMSLKPILGRQAHLALATPSDRVSSSVLAFGVLSRFFSSSSVSHSSTRLPLPLVVISSHACDHQDQYILLPCSSLRPNGTFQFLTSPISGIRFSAGASSDRLIPECVSLIYPSSD